MFSMPTLPTTTLPAHRDEATKLAVAGLHKLVACGRGDTGGSEACRAIILACYNGSENPLDLSELRRLDFDLTVAAFHVIHKSSNHLDEEIHNWDPELTSTIRGWAGEAHQRRQAAGA